MKPWWEHWPGRLEYEVGELNKSGIHCDLDKDAFGKGIAKLNLRHTVDGEEQKFIVIFPDIYPYMRFEIFAPDLELEHHQNPFSKNLCMIGMSSENWRISDTVAKFIISRLPKVLKSGKSSNSLEVKNLEEHQGEPITFYYHFEGSAVFVDSSWIIDSAINGGFLEIGIDKRLNSGIHCTLCSVKDRDRNIIVKAEPQLLELYPDRIEGKWVRCQDSILEKNPNSYYERLAAIDGSLKNPKWQNLKKRKLAIIGALFPEEVAWREKKDGWIFLVLDQYGKIK